MQLGRVAQCARAVCGSGGRVQQRPSLTSARPDLASPAPRSFDCAAAFETYGHPPDIPRRLPARPARARRAPRRLPLAGRSHCPPTCRPRRRRLPRTRALCMRRGGSGCTKGGAELARANATRGRRAARTGATPRTTRLTRSTPLFRSRRPSRALWSTASVSAAVIASAPCPRVRPHSTGRRSRRWPLPRGQGKLTSPAPFFPFPLSSPGATYGKPTNQGVNQLKFQRSLRSTAEERVARRCGNLRVLNSYWINQDGVYKYYEVILVDPSHKAIRRDARVNWICNPVHKRRESRGLTSAGKSNRASHLCSVTANGGDVPRELALTSLLSLPLLAPLPPSPPRPSVAFLSPSSSLLLALPSRLSPCAPPICAASSPSPPRPSTFSSSPSSNLPPTLSSSSPSSCTSRRLGQGAPLQQGSPVRDLEEAQHPLAPPLQVSVGVWVAFRLPREGGRGKGRLSFSLSLCVLSSICLRVVVSRVE